MQVQNIFHNKRIIYSLAVGLVCLVAIIIGVVVWLWRAEQQRAPTANNSFAFAAVGDFDITSEFTGGLAQIRSSKVAFTLGLGDFSYGRVTEREWCNMVTTGLGDTHPFELIVGNHDESNGSNMGRFAKCLPNRMPNMIGDYGQQYYFDYQGLARVIAISPDTEMQGEKYQYTRGSAQYQWLMDRIDQARSSGIKWIIVAMHKNCLTMGQKACEIGQDLQNALIDKRVDLVLQGHEHAYFRSKQLTTSAGCPTLPLVYDEKCVANASGGGPYQKGQGPILVINGAGGTALRDAQTNGVSAPYFASIHALNTSPSYGPSIFTVSNSKLEGKFVDINGQIQDAFAITD